jgi:hypothetical protein
VPFRASISGDLAAVEGAVAEARAKVAEAERAAQRRAATRGSLAPHGGGVGGAAAPPQPPQPPGPPHATAASTAAPSSKTALPGKVAPSGKAAPAVGKATLAKPLTATTPDRALLQRGLFAVLVDIYRRDGPRALLRGLLPRVLIQGPASAATFVCFEQVKRLSRKEDKVDVLN